MSEATARRTVFLLRFGIWVLVVVLAVVAFHLRAVRAAQGEHEPSRQLNGVTSQGMPIWATVDGGRVVTVQMNWRASCRHETGSFPWPATFSEPADAFVRDGRRFSAGHTRGWPERTARPSFSERVEGVLSGDARSARGTATLSWTGDRRFPASACRASVRWRASAG
jgi:hypothetical protein